MLKEAVKILEAIEALPGTKYVTVGVLPTSTYTYAVTPEGVSGNRIPILSTICHAMDIGGTILIKHKLPFKTMRDGNWEPVFHTYAMLLGNKMYRVCTEREFNRFFRQFGTYRQLRVKPCES